MKIRNDEERKYREGYNARLDESLGMRDRGIHHQSMKDRRDESKGMEKMLSDRAYMADRSMDKKMRKKYKKFLRD